MSTTDTTSQSTPRGWYQHSADPLGVQRWFDGVDWTPRTTGRPRGGTDLTSHADQPSDAFRTGADTRSAARQHCPPTPGGPAPSVPPPSGRGWSEYPGDPRGVQRWYDGTRWTNRLTGGTASDQAAAAFLPVSSSTAAQRPAESRSRPLAPATHDGFIPMMYNPATGESAFLDPASGTLRIRPRYSNGRRVGYSVLWSFYVLVLGLGGLGSLAHGQIVTGLLGIALAILAGRYAGRIWTYRARTLWLLLFF